MSMVRVANTIGWIVRLFRRPRAPLPSNGRDVVSAHLESLGVAASKAEQGRPQERIGAGEYSSRGLINISGGPISWANILTSGRDSWVGRIVYGIPASGLSRVGDVQVWSIRVRRIPRVGKVVGVRWESYMKLPSVLRPLDEDMMLKELMVQHLREDVEILSHPVQGCWLLAVGKRGSLYLPSAGEWSCYQAIASVLVKLR